MKKIIRVNIFTVCFAIFSRLYLCIFNKFDR